jgi:hypothetical protein
MIGDPRDVRRDVRCRFRSKVSRRSGRKVPALRHAEHPARVTAVGRSSVQPLPAGWDRRRDRADRVVRLRPTDADTAALPPSDLLLLLPYPLIVWGADELLRYLLRRSDQRRAHGAPRAQTSRPDVPKGS